MSKRQGLWVQNTSTKVLKLRQDWIELQEQSSSIMASLRNQVSQLPTLTFGQDPSKLGVLLFFGDFEKLLSAKYIQYFELLMKTLLKNLKEFEKIVKEFEAVQIEGLTFFKQQTLNCNNNDFQKQETLKITEIFESLLLIRTMFENEYQAKKDIIDKIDYTMGKEIESLYQNWISESNILNIKVLEILENMKSF